ncbi:MAG: ABC transporter permease [Anaerolineae bacterium]|nr:ABC transporter permease [Anaerolineae bacterium]MCA9886713.1 ABC transporter permease [Anaerolineae bacterium]MCA9891338.1 ABC transporter permease [Anaerolineae bacterium]MCB9460104.1 ABC transporter permease [Anaerolineaceae bacterium]
MIRKNIIQRVAHSATYMLRNPKLLLGFSLLVFLLLIGIAGPLFVDTEKARPISVPSNMPPSAEYPLGTDSGGRDILAVIVVGTPQTLRMGVLAGFFGVLLGTMLGLFAGFYGGYIDLIISGLTDTMLTIPPLAVLLVVAASVRSVSVDTMAIIIAALSWMFPARTIRAQVLSLKEQPYISMARLGGLGNFRIIIEEILPNILPLAAASFVGATSGAILAGIGLEVLGLGPQRAPTLGMTIYWALLYSALIRGMWWWWLPPILILIILFVGLFLTSAALDEYVNPRLRSKR